MGREQVKKMLHHAAMYGFSHATDALAYAGTTTGRFSPGGTFQAKSRLKREPKVSGDGVWMHVDWLKEKLPRAVFNQIAFVQPYVEPGTVELGFLSGATVVLPRRRREFRTDTTLARICLEAP